MTLSAGASSPSSKPVTSARASPLELSCQGGANGLVTIKTDNERLQIVPIAQIN